MKHILRAYYDEVNIIDVELEKTHYNGLSKRFSLRTGSEVIPLEIISSSDSGSFVSYKLKCPTLDLSKEYFICDEHLLRDYLDIRYVVRTGYFEETYYYDGNDLGCNYTSNHTTFKVWAPTACKVLLELEDPNGNVRFHSMLREDKGVWVINIYGDIVCYKYRYGVEIGGKIKFAIDPYAFSSTPNHEKSVVIDLTKINVENNNDKLPKLNSLLDSIIYELHVRDFSSSEESGMINKGKFVAFTEHDTKTKNGYVTGIDYIRNLGVTHIQLLPFYDFGSVDELNQFDYYNWGYDPVQYSIPEGSYASNVLDPYSRVIDCKKMIESIHESGMRVIMDVVYNHMFNRETSSFETLVPHYYFRIGRYGEKSNGSFCGNDFDSTQKMTSKFIIDSCLRWVDLYNVDGFRFDLMGIIDINTMNEISRVCLERKSDFIIYGEGWNMPTMIPDNLKTTQFNNSKTPNIGYFSDRFRDVIKGSTNSSEAHLKGYCSGSNNNLILVKDVLLASTCFYSDSYSYKYPSQVINYVECHDNATLWDKLSACCNDESEELREKRQKLITAVTLLSQGIPFIHAGQEFLRTKNGEHNSYILPDSINKLDWKLMEKNIDIVNYVKDVINIRKEFNCFKQLTKDDILNNVDISFTNNGLCVYKLRTEERGYSEVLVLINPNKKVEVYSLNDGYEVIMTENGRLATPFQVNNLMINSCSLVIVAKGAVKK